MYQLTPELFLISAFDGDTSAAETRQIDMNLARRSAMIINRITGIMEITADVTTGFDVTRRGIQELDLDPDNTTIIQADLNLNDIITDSSRIFRQLFGGAWDTAAGAVHSPTSLMQKDFSHVPLEKRPVSITNLRHHLATQATISCYYHCEIHIEYHIVELTLLELGIINASRR